MSYLHNAWYPAAWSGTLKDEPLARRMLDQPIVLFRDGKGLPCALYDACPHRFAPLSRGKVKDGVISCGYHGLQFDGSGQCVRNPHGKGVIPKALGVRKFPVTERYGMIWVWTGESEKSDEALLPSLPVLEDDTFSWVFGELEVSANYELVIDNLLDLTHVEYLHPFLANEGGADRLRFKAEQVGNRVSAYYDAAGEPITGLFQILWQDDSETANLRAYMHWTPPTYLVLETSMGAGAEPTANDAHIPVLHLLTPETDDATRYFWAAGRNREHGNEQVSEMLHFGTQHAFVHEDEPMIKAVRSRMQSNDLFAHRPALLQTDEAGVRARRTLAKLIEEEQSARGLDG